MSSNQFNRIGSPTSFWLRSIRYRTDEGKPLPQMTMLCLRLTTGKCLPFAIMTQTDNGRLIIWPPLPKNVPMLSDDGTKGVTDHVTLQLSSRESHVTSFSAKGQRHHLRRGWRLHEQGSSGLSRWFDLLVRRSTIEQQDHVVEVDVRVPTSDEVRRTEEFRRHAQDFLVKDITAPPDDGAGDYVYCVFYLQTKDHVDMSGLATCLSSTNIDTYISNLPLGTQFPIQPTALTIGTSRLIVATATPPGAAKDDPLVGFPLSQ